MANKYDGLTRIIIQNVGGKGFTHMAKEGDRVRKGQLLLKFDMEFIKSQGLPQTTPVIITNTDDCR